MQKSYICRAILKGFENVQICHLPICNFAWNKFRNVWKCGGECFGHFLKLSISLPFFLSLSLFLFLSFFLPSFLSFFLSLSISLSLPFSILFPLYVPFSPFSLSIFFSSVKPFFLCNCGLTQLFLSLFYISPHVFLYSFFLFLYFLFFSVWPEKIAKCL